MKASELRLGEYYKVKHRTGSYQYMGQRRDKPFKDSQFESMLFVFRNDSGSEVLKSTCHGIEACNFVNSVPVKTKVASALPQVEDYDNILSRAEMFATFLTTIKMKPGVTDVEIDGVIVPSIYIAPNDFGKLQELIQSIYLSKLEQK